MFKNNTFFYLLFSISIFLALTLPKLVTEGMFLDGTLYASIARNMADGLGTFWKPHYTFTNANVFYGHPPLALYLESLLFKIFGDHLYVERLYSFLTALITIVLLIKVWKIIYKDSDEEKHLYWLPVLLWAIIPVVSWSYSNNMLDNSLTVFCLLAVICILKGFELKQSFNLYFIFSGICMVAAFLTKGPVALFPLVIPVLFFISTKKISLLNLFISTGIILLVIAIAALCLMNIESSKQFITQYFKIQLHSSLTGNLRESSRFIILYKLLMELIPPILLTLLIMSSYKIKYGTLQILQSIHKSYILFFALVAIASSFPIMLSNKQLVFYLLPSMPYYAIVFALIITPIAKHWIHYNNTGLTRVNIIKAISIFSFCIVLFATFFFYKKVGRDQKVMEDIKLISRAVGRNTIIGECPELYTNWGLHAYFARYANISLDRDYKKRDYVIISNKCSLDKKDSYQKISLPTNELELYKIQFLID